MNDDKKLKDLIRDLVVNHGINKLEVTKEPLGAANIEYESSDECHWVKGKDDIYRCEQKPGETCRSGSCAALTITFTNKDGMTRTVSYCECSGYP